MVYNDIIKIEENWKNNIIQIGKIETPDQRLTITKQFINELYAFDEMDVLFKPTKAIKEQFRSDKEGAISYFIGGSNLYKEDKGFALNAWEDIEFENKNWIIKNDYALVMGNYFFKKDVKSIKVEFTLGFHKTDKNQVKINLHHSSLPFKNCKIVIICD